ncbi:uncharacterized protein LOC112493693 isoform X2 [Cephus cinctus]|nr:uncharacterized protein LOC112493693 isoform X2 [Cephus cinctus]
MIKPEDLADLVDMKSLAEEEEKYKPLHSHVEHYNKREVEVPIASSDFLPYFPANVEYDGNFIDDEKPFIAGFKEDLDKYNFAHGENENLDRKKRNASGVALKIIPPANHLPRIKRSNRKSKRDDDYVSSEHPNIEFMEKMSGRNTTGLEFEEEANTGMLTIPSSVEYSESITRETTKLVKVESTVRTTGIPITDSSSRDTTKLNGETNAKQTTRMSSSEYSLTVVVKNEFTTGRHPVTKGPVEGTTGSKDGSSVEDYFEKTQGQTVMSNLSTTKNSKDDLGKPDDITSEKGITSTNYNFLETTKESSRVDENIDNSWISQKETTPHDEESYKDEELELEYSQQIKDDMNSSKTYNYTDTGEPEETAGDALKKLVELKKPKNCTKEELTQFGIKALECLAFDYQHAKNKTDVKKVLTRTWIVIRIWMFIYICIAIPCWCQKGWCCCCFRCKFCFPRERIESAKEYYAKYPPGILQEVPVKGTADETIKYTPTLFEVEAYERFEAGIRNL